MIHNFVKSEGSLTNESKKNTFSINITSNGIINNSKCKS